MSMEDYLREEEIKSKPLAHGDIIDGVVVRVDPDEVLVDVGSKSEGVISARELGTHGDPDMVELQSGDHIKVFVLQPENEDGNVVLSLRRARAESVWLKAQDKQTSGEPIEADVREQNKGGLIVSIMGLRGFLPTSQVARAHSSNLEELVGQHISVKIIEVNRKRNRLIVSQKAAFDEDRARQRSELFERLKVGDVIRGKVSGLTSYGAFVNLGGADGLIHISELSWDRIGSVADVLQVGQDVRVKVIKLDPEQARISLSRSPPGSVRVRWSKARSRKSRNMEHSSSWATALRVFSTSRSSAGSTSSGSRTWSRSASSSGSRSCRRMRPAGGSVSP
jgi:small subunit ribosomal protein S1